jgi:hypothetical protein
MITSTSKYLDGEYIGAQLIEDGDYVWVAQRSGNYLYFRKMYVWDWDNLLFSCPVNNLLYCYNKNTKLLIKV